MVNNKWKVPQYLYSYSYECCLFASDQNIQFTAAQIMQIHSAEECVVFTLMGPLKQCFQQTANKDVPPKNTTT